MLDKLLQILKNARSEFNNHPVATTAAALTMVIAISAINLSGTKSPNSEQEVPAATSISPPPSTPLPEPEAAAPTGAQPSSGSPLSDPKFRQSENTSLAESEEKCNDSLYIAFTFPKYANVSHYKIEPPGDTTLIDNGDSTGYLTGSCVSGHYRFEFANIVNDGGNFVRKKHKGYFVIKDNSSSQCEVTFSLDEEMPRVICY